MPNLLTALKIDEVSLVDAGANPGAEVVLVKRHADGAEAEVPTAEWDALVEGALKAVWTAAFINDLPDASFAVIEPGGKKADGKTEPRSLRHLPYKGADGAVDLPHLRNALARLDQTKLSDELKAKARAKLEAAAKEAGMGAKKSLAEIVAAFVKMEPVTMDEAMEREEMMHQWWKVTDAFHSSLRSIMDSDADNKAALIQTTTDQFVAHVKTIVPKISKADAAPFVAAVRAISDPAALLAEIAKLRKGGPMSEFDKTKLTPEAVAHLDGLEKQIADQTAELAELRKAKPTGDEEDVLKDLSPAARAVVEKAQADAADAQKRAAEAEQIAKTERDARELVDLEKRAEREIPSLPGTGPEKARVLKAIRGLPEAERAQLTKMLAAGEAAMRLTQTERGSAGEGEPASAWAKIQARAAELRKEDKALSEAQAVSKVLETEPALHAEYNREQAARA